MSEFNRGSRSDSGQRREGGFRRGGSGPRRDGFRSDSGSRGGGFKSNFGPKEMHKATCSECGQECEVPFKPTEGKPVYCRECFRKRRSF